MNRMERLFHRLADEGEPESAAASLLQNGLAALAPLYGAGAATNRLLHEYGVRQRRALPAIVFSVGNITLGGTGKTPFTVWLARWLAKEGKRPVVLTRGYGREDEDRLLVVHDGRRLRTGTREAGDEPVLIARTLGDVPVVACADRHKAGRYALRRFPVETLVLDDGFQHVALERQADIVLLDATRPLSRLRVFPRGTLREPLGALERAHLIVLTRCDQARGGGAFARSLQKRFPSVPIVRTKLAPTSLRDLSSGERVDLSELRGKRVVLAAGVGHPASVRRTVASLGARVVRTFSPGDHPQYRKEDVLRWDAVRRRMEADWIVVTSKDAIKLRELGTLPDHVLELRTAVRFLDAKEERRATRVLRSRLHARRVRGHIGSR